MFKLEEIKSYFVRENIPTYRLKQILNAIFKQGKHNFSSISSLPLSLRSNLDQKFPIYSIKPIISQKSSDKTTEKVLFQLNDNQKIEAVLMKYRDGRNSLCLSSQAGCQLGCKFCATGKMKFGRNLTIEEIAEQALFFWQKLIRQKLQLTNIIFMGMGEPFMNYHNVLNAIKMINSEENMNFGARRITISTAGICSGIEKLAEENIQINLAVSLHAPNQNLREQIMPIAKHYTLTQLMNSIKLYIEKTNRRVSYEYVMLENINDSEENAEELSFLIKNQLCHVNLIPYNPTSAESFNSTSKSKIQKFQEILKQNGINATTRVTLGQEIDAACGQLANKALNTTT